MSFAYNTTLSKVVEEGSYRRFIDKEFAGDFFRHSTEFINQSPAQLKSGFFSSKTKTITSFLDKVSDIVDKSRAEDYVHGLLDSNMADFFRTLLHPRNGVVYREKGIHLYFRIASILGEQADDFLSPIDPLIYDFSVLGSDSHDGHDFEKWIKIDERPLKLSKDELCGNLRWLLTAAVRLPAAHILPWWKRIQKNVIGFLYGNITRVFDSDSSVLTDNAPISFHQVIISYVLQVIKQPNVFQEVLQMPHSPDYLFEILRQTSVHGAKELLLLNFLTEFLHGIFQQEKLVEHIHDLMKLQMEGAHTGSCFHTAFSSIFRYMESAFDRKMIPEKTVDELTKLMCLMFDVLYPRYSHEACVGMVTQLATHTSSCSKFIAHMYATLLALFINNKIYDQRLWGIVIQSGAEHRSLILSTYGNVSSFVGLGFAETLLNFDAKKLATALDTVTPMNTWNLVPVPPANIKLTDWRSDVVSFYGTYKDEFTPNQNLYSPIVRELRLPIMNTKNWSFDLALQCLRVMRKAFDWEIEKDPELQFKVYLNTVSTMYPLLKLVKIFPVILSYQRDFLAGEYLNWFRKCVSPNNSNEKIVAHALNIMGQIIHDKTALSHEVVCDWHVTLNHYMNSENPDIKKIAYKYAQMALLEGAEGSHLLLSAISSGFPWYTETTTNDDCLNSKQAQNAASCLLALNVTADIASQTDFKEVDDDAQSELKRDAVTYVEHLKPIYHISCLVTMLIEESLAGRELIMETLVKKIVACIDDLTTSDNAYALSPLLLVAPEIEKTKPGSLESILEALIFKLKSTELDETTYVTLVEVTVDLIIYSAYVIDCIEFYKSIQEISKSWGTPEGPSLSPENAQFLQHILMHFAANFLRYPFPRVDCPVVEKGEGAIYGTSPNHIMKVNKDTIASVLPTGRYQWNFKSVIPDPDVRTLHEDSNIDTVPQEASATEKQKPFSAELEDFFTDLYDNKLADFDVHASLCKPEDFDISHNVELTPNLQSPALAQNVPTRSVGSPAVSFMSSIGFFTGPMIDDLYPTLADAREDTESRAFAPETEYRHPINVRLLGDAPDPHFDDFKSGLGFWSSHMKQYRHVDCSHDIIFGTSVENPDVMIIWTPGVGESGIVESYKHEITIRIEITPRPSGLFAVSARTIKNLNQLVPNVEEFVVSKRALPVFVISQILVNVHICHAKTSNIQKPLKVSSALLNEMRQSNFSPYPMMLRCQRNLYEQ